VSNVGWIALSIGTPVSDLWSDYEVSEAVEVGFDQVLYSRGQEDFLRMLGLLYHTVAINLTIENTLQCRIVFERIHEGWRRLEEAGCSAGSGRLVLGLRHVSEDA